MGVLWHSTFYPGILDARIIVYKVCSFLWMHKDLQPY